MLGKKTDRVETLIGVNSTIKGETNVNGTLRVDGNFEGNINAEWVIIGEKGKVKGDIKANGVVIGGTVEGNINAESSIEIRAKGRVLGDVHTKKLTIIEGGIFEGRSYMISGESTKVVEIQKNQQV
jgi:cytoskeletal protein CcmA (bactofilin family)